MFPAVNGGVDPDGGDDDEVVVAAKCEVMLIWWALLLLELLLSLLLVLLYVLPRVCYPSDYLCTCVLLVLSNSLLQPGHW